MESSSETVYSKQLQVQKIHPTIEECLVNNSVKCMEEGCQHTFTSESNLALHISKSHKRLKNLPKISCKQYYCPAVGCVYQNDKFFKNMKCLRQHYMKVHLAKEFSCKSCQKMFQTENILKNHIEYCGVDFKCHECEVSYGCYETLKTHARRKKHKILPKFEYKTSISSSASDNNITKQKSLLPKNCISLIIFSDSDKTFNQECQTVNNIFKPKLKSKMTQVNRVADFSLNSQQTQTGSKNHLYTVETQTIGDFISLNSKSSDDIINSVTLKSSKTQTDIVESRSMSCNTSFNINDFEFTSQTETISSSTQTQDKINNIFSTSTTTHDSIYTDTSDLLSNSVESINNFEFDNCHMETQTDFMFEEGMFDCDYMSNTYTQTCDEIFNEFGFNDIETQTVFDDMLRSVESQTTMSHGKKIVPVCRDIAHMETQTDVEFRQMLEVINS